MKFRTLAISSILAGCGGIDLGAPCGDQTPATPPPPVVAKCDGFGQYMCPAPTTAEPEKKVCVDILHDTNNCGECGKQCTGGTVCMFWKYAQADRRCECPNAGVYCDADKHCHEKGYTCPVVCAAGQVLCNGQCIQGTQCPVTCSAGQKLCSDNACHQCCSNTDCSGATPVCSASGTCVAQQQSCTPSDPQANCGGNCSQKCDFGKRCNSTADCAVGLCTGGICQPFMCEGVGYKASSAPAAVQWWSGPVAGQLIGTNVQTTTNAQGFIVLPNMTGNCSLTHLDAQGRPLVPTECFGTRVNNQSRAWKSAGLSMMQTGVPGCNIDAKLADGVSTTITLIDTGATMRCTGNGLVNCVCTNGAPSC